MPTRTQNPENRTFRPEAFASSAEYERGELGNLVAARCHALADPEVASILWWLQQVSWKEGGLLKFAQDFLEKHQALVGTRSMHKLGMEAGRIYNAAEVQAIRVEIPLQLYGNRFRLKGEMERAEAMARAARRSLGEEQPGERIYPNSYPLDDFLELCELSPELFAGQLRGMLLDPRTDPKAGLWNMPGLYPALCAWRDQEIEAARRSFCDTDISRRIFLELDFALETRAFVLVEGREGIGKSEAARNWCAQHPGRAIYVRLESGSDETTLYRGIAQRIGTACSYQRKAVEMRARIQDALQGGQIMLVLDEAHFLWPQSERCQGSVPKRVDWLRTALIDFGVPVALISTPQFFARACARFRKAGWNSLQIQRRLARTVQLPEDLPTEDLLSVARRAFPHGSDSLLKRVAALALSTVGYLTTIDHVRKRYEFLCRRQPNEAPAKILDQVLADYGLSQLESATVQAPVKESLNPAKERVRSPTFPVGHTAPEALVKRSSAVPLMPV